MKCYDPASIAILELKKHFGEISLYFKFTTREKEIALLTMDRMPRKDMADKLGISLETVKMHLKSIYKKAEVGSSGELAQRMSDVSSQIKFKII